ncbi:hydrogenase [Desulfuromonas carbonis]|uniref:NADH-quinone oxidoreductase subunit B family protein n=1 Tax=Desulfuromonas sp. DDH964 TaxID=1823759 RepID=UPI00078E6F48|nr:hydrogenase [Desulfuromonas sp. DDH964]AMV73064.1 Ech-hydrogenase-related complex small subunit [Desulfuromonas sp. DDH964]
MLGIIRERLRQGHRTGKFPRVEPTLPSRFRGLPVAATELSAQQQAQAVAACPCEALASAGTSLCIDLGRCLFCGDCPPAEQGALQFSSDYRLAASNRHDLLVGEREYRLAEKLNARMLKLFGRSLKLRQVSAGGCNACEADLNVLGTLVFDLGRFGIQFVASPRHADGLLVTGPVTANMRSALLDTYAAIPEPKLVIASGACAIGGGPFRDLAEVNNGVSDLLPVDLYIPGCPPHPYTALDGLLRLLGRR